MTKTTPADKNCQRAPVMMACRGSCVCGAVAFQADGDLAQDTTRCNCRFCRKMGCWEMHLPDAERLRILRGWDALAETPRALPFVAMGLRRLWWRDHAKGGGNACRVS